MLGNKRECKHNLEVIANGFRIGEYSYSPTIFKCKLCNKYFKLVAKEEAEASILIEMEVYTNENITEQTRNIEEQRQDVTMAATDGRGVQYNTEESRIVRERTQSPRREIRPIREAPKPPRRTTKKLSPESEQIKKDLEDLKAKLLGE